MLTAKMITLTTKTLILKIPLQTMIKKNRTHSRNKNKVEISALLNLLLVAMMKQAKEPVKEQAQKIVSFLFKKTENMKNFINAFLMKRMNSNLYEFISCHDPKRPIKLNMS